MGGMGNGLGSASGGVGHQIVDMICRFCGEVDLMGWGGWGKDWRQLTLPAGITASHVPCTLQDPRHTLHSALLWKSGCLPAWSASF